VPKIDEPLPIEFPVAGQNKRTSYAKQPPFSTVLASNVQLDAALEGRSRGGSRPGLGKVHSELLGGGNPIRMVGQVRALLDNQDIAIPDNLQGWVDDTNIPSEYTAAPWITAVDQILSSHTFREPSSSGVATSDWDQNDSLEAGTFHPAMGDIDLTTVISLPLINTLGTRLLFPGLAAMKAGSSPSLQITQNGSDVDFPEFSVAVLPYDTAINVDSSQVRLTALLDVPFTQSVLLNQAFRDVLFDQGGDTFAIRVIVNGADAGGGPELKISEIGFAGNPWPVFMYRMGLIAGEWFIAAQVQDWPASLGFVAGDRIKFTSGANSGLDKTLTGVTNGGTLVNSTVKWLSGDVVRMSDGDTFQIVRDPEVTTPKILGGNLVGTAASRPTVGVIRDDISELVQAARHRVSIYTSGKDGKYQVFHRVGAAGDATIDGVISELVINGNMYSGSHTVYKDGVPTVNAFAGGTLTNDIPVYFRVENDGADLLTTFLDGVAVDVYDASVVGMNIGKRTGFGLEYTSVENAWVGDFTVLYESTDPRNRNLLVASSNGLLYRQSDDGISMDQVVTALTLNSDVRLTSIERLGKLYIADHGDSVLVVDGVLTGGVNLDSPTILDWSILINKEDFRVEITDPLPGGVVKGVYDIEGVSASSITLSSSAGADATTVQFRVERAAKVFDPVANTLELLAPTRGQVPLGPTLIELFLDRLVLAGPGNNWFMSRAGDVTDWFFDDSDDDVLRAVSAISGQAGVIPGPITAIWAFTDDYMILATVADFWRLTGDPGAAGVVDNVTKKIGVVGKRTWAHAPDGVAWFLSRDGIWRLPPGAVGRPESVSREKLPVELLNLDADEITISMAYSITARGIYVFCTPEDGTKTCFFYDIETDSWWPIDHIENHHATAVLEYDADSAQDNAVVVGCKDGFLRRYSSNFESDDGTAISSFVWLGPYRLGTRADYEGILTQIQGTLAVSSGSVTWDVHAGTSAEDAAKSASKASGTWSERLNYTKRPRVRGQACFVRLSSTERWALEEIVARAKKAGVLRKR